MPIDDDATAIGAIADDGRRALYRYVVSRREPVGREEAAEALGIPVHRARFHLERLEEAGLLETDYARPDGRSGPGAGRPAKRYRRAARDIAVALPPRGYDLAGSLLASAIDAAAETGEPVTDAVARVAAERGRELGGAAGGAVDADRSPASARRDAADAPAGSDASTAAAPALAGDADAPAGDADALAGAATKPTTAAAPPDADPLAATAALLAEHGYEPHRTERGIELANCPFHELSRAHTRLVCGMNEALLAGVTDAVAPGRLRARLDPAPGRCCVVIEPDASAP